MLIYKSKKKISHERTETCDSPNWLVILLASMNEKPVDRASERSRALVSQLNNTSSPNSETNTQSREVLSDARMVAISRTDEKGGA